MKIFLSALETAYAPKAKGSEAVSKLLVRNGIQMKWNLMSFYYIKSGKQAVNAEFIRDHTESIMIDSGAHSFQKGVKVDWEKYTEKYARFITTFDRPNVIGYFEMDVDNIIGYERVKALRAMLENVSNKIIPVWHKNRGIEDFKEMCRTHRGRVVAITGFRNEDIKDHQYPMFVKYAHEQGCKIHCLGMTRPRVLDSCPFDYTDSSAWLASANRGRVYRTGVKAPRQFTRQNYDIMFIESYKQGVEMQRHYHNKWQAISRD